MACRTPRQVHHVGDQQEHKHALKNISAAIFRLTFFTVAPFEYFPVIFWSTSSHAQRPSPPLSHFQPLSSLAEYCLTEHFTAACHGSGEVIVMTSALYGRMRTGRCVREDYNLGCSSDVLGHFDEQCSGQSSCKVSVRSLVDVKPCQRDFASYLEASFQCLTGELRIDEMN